MFSRKKNTATYITFPIVDADGDVVTGAAGLDSEYSGYSDSSVTPYADLSNEAVEISTTTGNYKLLLTPANTNFDYINIMVKTSTSGAKTQHLRVNTYTHTTVASILTDTGTTIPGTITTIDNELSTANAALTTIDNEISTANAALTTIDNELSTANAGISNILVDTATTIPGTITTINNELSTANAGISNILVDTATTIPATLTTIDNEISTANAALTTIDNEISTANAALIEAKALLFHNTAIEFTFTSTNNTKVIAYGYNTASALTTHGKSAGAGLIANYSTTISYTSNKPTTLKMWKK